MDAPKLVESLQMKEELFKKACFIAMKAHKSDKPFIVEKIKGSRNVVFAFSGSWTVNDWYAGDAFGETKINLELFPCLRSIGNDEAALVNKAFLLKFEKMLSALQLQNEVEKRVKRKKQLVFTGHSSGGPIAILAAIWYLQQYQEQLTPLCVTFGSPLMGNHIFDHVLRRESWSSYFINFVTRYDIVPRIPLAPLSSIKQQFEQVIPFFDPKSKSFSKETICNGKEARDLYMAVMKNASYVVSQVACKLMRSTSQILESVCCFTDPSPYRPFGTYVFSCGSRKMVVVSNPDAVMHLLFYVSLFSNTEMTCIGINSLKSHLAYDEELQLGMPKAIYLEELEKLPLFILDGDINSDIKIFLNQLGLGSRARLLLQAAGALEMQKRKNQEYVNGKRGLIEEGIRALELYKLMQDDGNFGYYDTFRLSANEEDFQANINRLKLANIWDEIIHFLKKYELPDAFEVDEDWIKLGTRYRRVVEPLDIANYYRHLKDEDAGPYVIKGRPRRYRYTQRWFEYSEHLPTGSSGGSCFWAEVEELRIKTDNEKSLEDAEVRSRIQKLEQDMNKWVNTGELGKDVSLKESTFSKWWNRLPEQYRRHSPIC